MKHLYLLLFLIPFSSAAQTFQRSELPTALSIPWEMTYGPNGFLWISESDGAVSRVNPTTGEKFSVYVAPDFFAGDPSENHPECNNPQIQYGTLGLALHPDFLDPDSTFIYLYYSYNSGTVPAPKTAFKIRRIKWSYTTYLVESVTDIVTDIPSSYDHIGGRLMAIKQEDRNFLFLTIGDNGISEDNAPDCYPDQSLNPNNFTADPSTWNGKIHRFNMDGSIPYDNPISGNSMYTRGHRNPQGLMYNDNLDIIYNVEHGDRTDDEINVLHPGMNYGWKTVRGYHDGNHPGELDVVNNYTANPLIVNDSMVEPFFSWCTTPASGSSTYLDWCTPAPSDGIYYGSTGIPQWTNSLLVVTLKDGVGTDKEVYQFKLDGLGNLIPSTTENPNPKRFFGEDQDLNGRLRDIAISPDGKKIYLINNFGIASNKITVYTVDESSIPAEPDCVTLFPNPTQDAFSVYGLEDNPDLVEMKIYDLAGEKLLEGMLNPNLVQIADLVAGTYYVHIVNGDEVCSQKIVKY